MTQHDHTGPWAAIFVAVILLSLTIYGFTMVSQHQLDVIYDRVGAIQRQLECSSADTFVTDQEGNEYCLDVAGD